MVEFQDEEMKTFSESSQSVNHCDPAQEPLCDEPPRTCRTTVKQRQKRAEWGSEMHNMLYIQYLQIFRRVVMASERVPVASRPVGVASQQVRVASQQVLMRYELMPNAMFQRIFPAASRPPKKKLIESLQKEPFSF
jgi:hypothetical protein